MKKEVSYKELQKFDTTATAYLIRTGYYIPGIPATNGNPAKLGHFSDKENTKLSANIRNIIKQWQKHYEEYSSDVDDLQLDFCAVDEKTKVILKDANGNRMFTPENEKQLKKAIKELSDKKVTIHTRITEGAWDLSNEEKEVFNGIVIPEFNLEEDS